MTSLKSLLDMDNPKGKGIIAADNVGVDKWPDEHGNIITDADILLTNAKILTVPGTVRQHRIFYKIHPENQHTVMFLHGGTGRAYAVTSSELVMPSRYLVDWPLESGVNIVVIDFDHGMPFNWQVLVDNAKSKLPTNCTGNTDFLKLSSMVDGVQSDLAIGFNDFMILHRAVATLSPNSTIWAAGHCNSCYFLAKYCDLFHPVPFAGLIMLSPAWKLNWQDILQYMKYFRRPTNLPMLTVNHSDDRCTVVAEKITLDVVRQASPSRHRHVTLTGGIDQGLPNFSLGYHGYFGLDTTVINEIVSFVNDK